MLDQQKSAASFFIGAYHFGFEGASETVFVSGPLFGKVNLLQPATRNVFERGRWIDFEAVTYAIRTRQTRRRAEGSISD